MSLLFKRYSLVKVIYLLVRFKEPMSFLRITMTNDRNGMNEQSAQTRTLLFLKSLKLMFYVTYVTCLYTVFEKLCSIREFRFCCINYLLTNNIETINT